MTSDTQQWIYKLGAVTVGVCLLGCFAAMIISIFYFGDGEGLRILNGLTGPILGILGSVAALLAPHSIGAAVVATRNALNPAVPATSAAAPVGNGEPTSDPGGISATAIVPAVSGPGVD